MVLLVEWFWLLVESHREGSEINLLNFFFFFQLQNKTCKTFFFWMGENSLSFRTIRCWDKLFSKINGYLVYKEIFSSTLLFWRTLLAACPFIKAPDYIHGSSLLQVNFSRQLGCWMTYNFKHCEIAKRCSEYISSIFEVSSCFYQKTVLGLVSN